MRRISVRGIALHKGKLLCVRLKTYKGSLSASKDEWWCLPGGDLDENESLVEGVCREMIEETGVEPQVGDLLYVQQFTHSGKEYLEFFFHITNGKDYLTIDLSKTSHGGPEIAEIAFINPTEKTVLPDFLAAEDIVRKAESRSPTSIFSY
jgi:8-oxo-dGTP diphosphatase